MAPAILHRIIHGQPTPEPWQKELLTTRPALLPGYRRYRVKHADYPAILPSDSHRQQSSEPGSGESPSVVLGVVVTGLTEGDVYRLDNFEGSEYTKKSVTVRVVKSPDNNSGGGGSSSNDDAALQHGLDKTAQLADARDDVRDDVEVEEVTATTYVWTDAESALDLNSEWDFESFKKDKLQWWIGAPESEL